MGQRQSPLENVVISKSGNAEPRNPQSVAKKKEKTARPNRVARLYVARFPNHSIAL